MIHATAKVSEQFNSMFPFPPNTILQLSISYTDPLHPKTATCNGHTEAMHQDKRHQNQTYVCNCK